MKTHTVLNTVTLSVALTLKRICNFKFVLFSSIERNTAWFSSSDRVVYASFPLRRLRSGSRESAREERWSLSNNYRRARISMGAPCVETTEWHRRSRRTNAQILLRFVNRKNNGARQAGDLCTLVPSQWPTVPTPRPFPPRFRRIRFRFRVDAHVPDLPPFFSHSPRPGPAFEILVPIVK